MEIDPSRRHARERAAESPTMAALRRVMIASSMGLATVALVAANTQATMAGRSGAELAAPGTPTPALTAPAVADDAPGAAEEA